MIASTRLLFQRVHQLTKQRIGLVKSRSLPFLDVSKTSLLLKNSERLRKRSTQSKLRALLSKKKKLSTMKPKRIKMTAVKVSKPLSMKTRKNSLLTMEVGTFHKLQRHDSLPKLQITLKKSRSATASPTEHQLLPPKLLTKFLKCCFRLNARKRNQNHLNPLKIKRRMKRKMQK